MAQTESWTAEISPHSAVHHYRSSENRGRPIRKNTSLDVPYVWYHQNISQPVMNPSALGHHGEQGVEHPKVARWIHWPAPSLLKPKTLLAGDGGSCRCRGFPIRNSLELGIVGKPPISDHFLDFYIRICWGQGFATYYEDVSNRDIHGYTVEVCGGAEPAARGYPSHGRLATGSVMVVACLASKCFKNPRKPLCWQHRSQKRTWLDLLIKMMSNVYGSHDSDRYLPHMIHGCVSKILQA